MARLVGPGSPPIFDMLDGQKKCCCLLKISTFMTQIIGSWYKNIDRGFFHYVGESGSLESPACFMIKFGLFPPTQIVNHGDEVHIELVKSKKASQRAYAKAKKERCSLVAVARDLLANDMKSKTDATEVLLVALDQAKDDLRQKIFEARKARLPNSLRNF